MGMKNKTNFFLFISFISKRIKAQGFLRKSHQKQTLWSRDPGSGKNSSRIQDPWGRKTPDPGSQIPDPQHCSEL
jgi:hypothetical protein